MVFKANKLRPGPMSQVFIHRTIFLFYMYVRANDIKHTYMMFCYIFLALVISFNHSYLCFLIIIATSKSRGRELFRDTKSVFNALNAAVRVRSKRFCLCLFCEFYV